MFPEWVLDSVCRSAVGAAVSKICCRQVMLCVFESSAIVLAPYSVFTVSTSLYLSGVSSWKIGPCLPVWRQRSVPSPAQKHSRPPRADRKRLDHLAIVRVKNHQLLWLRPPRKAAGARGPCEGSRLPPVPPAIATSPSAWWNRSPPTSFCPQCVVDHSLAVGRRELRSTSQRNAFHHRAVRGSMTVALLGSPLNTNTCFDTGS